MHIHRVTNPRYGLALGVLRLVGVATPAASARPRALPRVDIRADGSGRVTGFSTADHGVSFDQAGVRFSNGWRTRLTHDAQSRPPQIVHQGPDRALTFNRSYDDGGRIVALAESAGTAGGGRNAACRYDRYGQLVQAYGSFSYDSNGNLEVGGIARFAEGDRLVSPSPPGGPVVRDFFGRLVEIGSGSTKVRLSYDPDPTIDLPIAVERSGRRVDFILASGQWMAVDATGVPFLHTDLHGSVVLVTSADGSVEARYQYSAFGVRKVLTERWESPLGHLGRPVVCDLVSLGRRLWPARGRFVEPDPVQPSLDLPQSLNRYAYTHGDPLNEDRLGSPVRPGLPASGSGSGLALAVGHSLRPVVRPTARARGKARRRPLHGRERDDSKHTRAGETLRHEDRVQRQVGGLRGRLRPRLSRPGPLAPAPAPHQSCPRGSSSSPQPRPCNRCKAHLGLHRRSEGDRPGGARLIASLGGVGGVVAGLRPPGRRVLVGACNSLGERVGRCNDWGPRRWSWSCGRHMRGAVAGVGVHAQRAVRTSGPPRAGAVASMLPPE